MKAVFEETDVRTALSRALMSANGDEKVVTLVLQEDGEVLIFSSKLTTVEIVGLLELSKLLVVDDEVT